MGACPERPWRMEVSVAQKYPNIELFKKINTFKKNGIRKNGIGREIITAIYVTYEGTRIGRLTYREGTNWNPAGYSATYFCNSQREDECETGRGGEYAGSAPTLYQAKMLVFKEWKEHATPYKPPYDVSFLPSGDNADFYPTPSNIAGKMLALVDWNGVRSILEPSAGKGDLIKCANNANYHGYRYRRVLEDVDCIERDQNLRYILKGMGYRVVHDDFLTFHTNKRYDLILMNPPFSEGDKHLIKALELQQNGGQIVCLLNAETIRNPYTQIRRLLCAKLNEYGAKILFVKNGFKRAERRSDVEVAIVYVNIEEKVFESEIIERMQKAAASVVEGKEAKDMIGGDYIERLITEYEVEAKATLALFREFNAMQPYIEKHAGAYERSSVRICIGDTSYDEVKGDGVNRYMRIVRGKYWWKLFSLPQLTERFTSNILEKYNKDIERMRDYDFSEFNIRQIIDELNASLAAGVHGAIMGLFDTLSEQHSWYKECEKNIHYFNGWATNKAHKVNKKVILPINGFSSGYGWTSSKLEGYNIYQRLSDIEKVLDYLDRGATSDISLQYAIKRAVAEQQTKNIWCKYFKVTFYKKGTCHITFHEQRIVDILNIYGARGKNWLPPDYGKRKYRDMSPEAQTVIDDFQGEAAYEEVMNYPDVYLPNTTTPLLTQ